MSESTTEVSEDAAETSTALELDVVLGALSELSGEDGGDWVRVPCSGADFPVTVASGGTPSKTGTDPTG